MGKLSNFLYEEVWPVLDAVSAGFLDDLKPSSKRASGAYTLTCPGCNSSGKAFYYPGSMMILCHRRKYCKHPKTSIWDFLSKSGYSNRDILNMLCTETNTSPPDRKKTQVLTPDRAIIKATRMAAKNLKSEIEGFLVERNLSFNDFEKVGWGYYPSSAYIEKVLISIGADAQVARARGYLKKDEKDFDRYQKRIVTFWEDSNGTVGLFGRSLKKNLEGNAKKYKYMFPADFEKNRPYRINNKPYSPVFFTEGYMDSDSLKLVSGVNASATGGYSINKSQALWLFKHGVTEVIHIIDGDKAGVLGGIDSIRNCESLGISVRIITLDPSQEDIDALRTSKQDDKILALLTTDISSAEFIARLFVNSCLMGKPVSDTEVINLKNAYELLPPTKKFECEAISRSLGVPIKSLGEHLRIKAALLDIGLTEEDIASAIEHRRKLVESHQGLSRQELSRQGLSHQGDTDLRREEN